MVPNEAVKYDVCETEVKVTSNMSRFIIDDVTKGAVCLRQLDGDRVGAVATTMLHRCATSWCRAGHYAAQRKVLVLRGVCEESAGQYLTCGLQYQRSYRQIKRCERILRCHQGLMHSTWSVEESGEFLPPFRQRRLLFVARLNVKHSPGVE